MDDLYFDRTHAKPSEGTWHLEVLRRPLVLELGSTLGADLVG